MVFATDFDPYDELERTGKTNAERVSVNNAQAIYVMPSEAKRHSEREIAGNVVSFHGKQPLDKLQVGAPATRVRLENKSLLLPRQPKLPLGLQLLNRLQQGSAVVMGVMVMGALAVYGSTVYVDKSTSRALVQLDELQGESQQLTSANESIKQSLAEQAAQEDSGLEPYEADDVILLTPAPLREEAAPEAPAPELPGPLGY